MLAILQIALQNGGKLGIRKKSAGERVQQRGKAADAGRPGDTVNVASRLQSAARPGSVTVGQRTMRATSNVVEYEELEPLHLKGKAEPVMAWEAVRVAAVHAVRRKAPVQESPLVGRDGEIATLETLYERVVREGAPHLVTLVGEAGRGRVAGSCASSSGRVRASVRARLPHRTLPPLRGGHGVWALGEVLRAECGIVDTDSADAAWRKLSAYVAGLFGDESKPLAEAGEREAALIGRLLGIEVPPELVPSEENPERLREAFFSGAAFRASRRAPAASR